MKNIKPSEDSLCKHCAEGFVVGEKVYCGANGCFRKLHHGKNCEFFRPKK